MRLFGKVNGAIDRFDRAGWLSGPFDLAFGNPNTITYTVYRGDTAGGAIDYGSPLATTLGLSYMTAALGAGTSNRFGVRASRAGLEESNTDAAVLIVLDAGRIDITNTPMSPQGLTATATQAGGCRVEWTAPVAPASRKPAGFHIYLGTPTVSYASPVATVPYAAPGAYRADLTGLSEGIVSQVAVRAYNATGEEANTIVASVTGEVTAPTSVDNLTATVI